MPPPETVGTGSGGCVSGSLLFLDHNEGGEGLQILAMRKQRKKCLGGEG